MSAPESAVRYFIPGASRLPRGWRTKLEESREREASYLISGAALDFADYRNRVGRIQGLNDAINLCQQMEDEEN